MSGGRYCPNCRVVSPPGAGTLCPNCGAVYPPPIQPVGPPSQEGYLLGSRGADGVLGFIGAILTLIVMGFAVYRFYPKAASSALLLYGGAFGVSFLWQNKYPALANGWRTGLVTLAALAVVGIIAGIFLLSVAIFQICSGGK